MTDEPEDRELAEAFVMATLHHTAPSVTWRVMNIDGVLVVFAPLNDLVTDISGQVERIRKQREGDAG